MTHPQEKLAALPGQWDEMAPQYEGDVRLMLTTCAQELRLRLKALSKHGGGGEAEQAE